ncbi:hypothetical protein LUZ61_006067 [Rhynchospora tenuis]|uniref:Protein kinase domain-containing protein n=1 Tax=Rhynchospora tenuis TaxID=198213 RepID=A0AAD5ZQR2_9POAL|nr:hypothetical protein LUZ61_006067 [Rhynchospora tenuis]
MPLLSPLYPLSLSLILLISIHGTYSSNPNPCSSSSYLCGDITVTYPFSFYNSYSTDNTANSSYCGYPGLRIYCYDNEYPILFLSSYNYTIKNINYTTDTISLIDTEILLQNSSTPKIRHNVSLTANTLLNYTELVVELYFFINCTTFGPNYNAILNPAGGVVKKYSYVFPETLIPPQDYYEWVDKCDQVVVAPALGPVVEPRVWNLSTSYGSVLLDGFQLEWSDPSEDCLLCEKRGGQCGYNVTSNSTYITTCFCTDGNCDKKTSKHTRVIIGISLGIFTSLFAICILCLLVYRRRDENVWFFGTEERKRAQLVEATLGNFKFLAPKRYNFSEIRKMTKSFNQKIGQGGFASVFKGELMDGSPVAMKVFKDRESSGVEFTSEVVSIARTSHVNIVRLLGFSIKGSKRALIYEFMSNGSLDKYLRESENSTLSHVKCTRLFEIAVGIARGLEYLHRDCSTRIVHFDIKPHNILLDQDYCPKISDFGLAKFCQPKESIISMSGMRGTIGYIAPEVFSRNFGVVSSKSDVYSYGMMVLEMFGGKEHKTKSTASSSEIYFPDSIYNFVEQSNICSMYGVSDDCEELVRKMMIVGLWCIQLMPNTRPTMSAVLDMLERSVEDLTMPPKLHISLPPVLVQEATDSTAPNSYNQQ